MNVLIQKYMLSKPLKMLLMVCAIFLLLSGTLSAQQAVSDKYKRTQLENMVVIRWGKFIPKWYYFLFHDKYRKGEDRRTMRQLMPTMAAVAIAEAQSKQQREDTQELFEQALWVEANVLSDYPYLLYYQPIFKRLNEEIDALIATAMALHVDPEIASVFQEEQSRINGQITILREGFLPKGESARGMAGIEDGLQKLRGMVHKYIAHQQILNKYTKP